MRRTLEVNALATLNLLGALLRQGTPPRLLLVGSAEQYGIGPAGGARVHRGRRPAAGEPVRLEQGLAGGAGLFLQPHRALADPDDAHLQPHRAAAGPGLRLRRLCAADRPHRAAARANRCCAWAISTRPATFSTSATWSPPIAWCSSAAPPGRRTTSAPDGSWRIADLLQILLGHAVIKIKVEVEVARHRPVDIPVLLGDPGRLVRDTGWEPHRAMEATLNDLLEYWRERTAAEQAWHGRLALTGLRTPCTGQAAEKGPGARRAKIRRLRRAHSTPQGRGEAQRRRWALSAAC